MPIPFYAGQTDDPYAYQNRNRPWTTGFPEPRPLSPIENDHSTRVTVN